DLVATSEEFLQASWAAASSGGEAPIDLGAAAYRSIGDVRQHTLGTGRAWWSTSPFARDPEAGSTETDDGVAPLTRALPFEPAPLYRGDTEQALADIKGWLH